MVGVQNLKVLFEKPYESTSPDRGRSGASSEAGIETPSRPLSKVRTSFVSVERARHRSVSIESSRIYGNSSMNEIGKINETAINDDKNKEIPTTESILNTTPTKGSKVSKKAECVAKDKERESDTKKAVDMSTNLTAKGSTSRNYTLSGDKTSNSKKSPLSPRINSFSASSRKAFLKSPVAATPRRSNMKVNEAKPIRKSLLSSIDVNSTSRPQLRNLPADGKMQSKEPSQSIRVKKLLPKSSRSIKLSASLTTHTASSSSKAARSNISASKQQSLCLEPNKLRQSIGSQRRMSTASSVSLVPRAQVIKKPSNNHLPIESSRKSSRHSTTSHNATNELSFLDRMTRPTASSSSKTTEKPTVANRKSGQNTRKIVNNVKGNGSFKPNSKKTPSTPKRDGNKPQFEAKSDTKSKKVTANNISVSSEKTMDISTLALDHNSKIECAKITSPTERGIVEESEVEITDPIEVNKHEIEHENKSELENTFEEREPKNSTVLDQQHKSDCSNSDPGVML